MEQVRLMCLLTSSACFLFLVIGLFKPWVMLWWEDVQNRRKVIQVYGSVAAVFFIAYWILKFF